MEKNKKTLHDLSVLFEEHKSMENHHKQKRIEVEKKICELLVSDKDEGTVSEKGDFFKVSVTRKFNRKLDIDTYNAVKDGLVINPVITKHSIDLKALRAIEQANEPQFKLCQSFISVELAKPSIKVERIKEK
jgi:hypothetical protein